MMSDAKTLCFFEIDRAQGALDCPLTEYWLKIKWNNDTDISTKPLRRLPRSCSR